MIGNDIVDLGLARQESNWRRPRYLAKIFTPEEQQLIADAHRPTTMVWLLWSCKEAAYKRWASEHQQRSFFPNKIEVQGFQQVQETDLHHTAADGESSHLPYTSSVQIMGHCYTVHTSLKGDLIHSWTLPKEKKLLLRKVDALPCATLSEATRSLVYKHLEQCFQWSPADLSIQKNEQGRPFVYYQNKQCPLSLSLAHHGRYGGFVLAESEHFL